VKHARLLSVRGGAPRQAGAVSPRVRSAAQRMPQSDEEAARRAHTQGSRGVIGRLCAAWEPNGLMDLLHPTSWVAGLLGSPPPTPTTGHGAHTSTRTSAHASLNPPLNLPQTLCLPGACVRQLVCLLAFWHACQVVAAREKKRKKRTISKSNFGIPRTGPAPPKGCCCHAILRPGV